MKTKISFLKQINLETEKSEQKLNKLRAAVLGANDGIVSIAALVVGVAGASNSSSFILTAGLAGIVAGSISMGVGEYVSVSSQRDSEKALIEKEHQEHLKDPDFELKELINIYIEKGLSPETASKVAEEFTNHGALTAHLDAELGIDPNNLINPWYAAYTSTLAFIVGATIPMVTIIFLSPSLRVPFTFLSVLFALVVTGILSAYVGGADKKHAIMRIVLGGMLAMAVTFGIGKLIGVAGI